MLELSRRDARRLAVRAQLLAHPRPQSVAEVAEGLSAIQMDLTAHVATSPELVFWSRVGRGFRRGDLDAAIAERELVEIGAYLRAAADVPLHRVVMADWPGDSADPYLQSVAAWVEDNSRAREEVLAQLAGADELTAREFEDIHFEREWRSSGWNNQKSLTMLLERLAERGEVAVSRRQGRERVWALADDVFPAAAAAVSAEEAHRELMVRRLRSLGLAREKAAKVPSEPLDVGPVGEPAVVDGVKGTWRVDPELLDAEFRGRTALLSPLDRLVVDRKRLDELFEFDFALEMYKPAEVRIWGYYALPVLHLDRLVGTVDAQAVRDEGVLRVHGIREEGDWSGAVRRAVDAELETLAHYLQLELARSR
ncbi:winged helix DNA-binding domain-containing protein [Aestuariimicrobium sp. p3-SID1156]|uniref:DNA glycosylase AlkZ-like family protein n=1 Tax=Aestuariimicrobium sp. p3-SID1156 TaxID=2916038 RepID=UPI00223BFC4C|nr:crosslink repair DNA glycosylase YcaQ family protein [Aestuariimicrobium sp. p3-SID1156]MCT1459576.1 winged helix DNA-binding domain-containing protein [Aestuariimicrobium sp. p3-SID1156]